MRRKAISVALEAIAFQEGAFFRELTTACQALRGYGRGMDDAAYWADPSVQEIAQVILRHTNIQVVLQDGNATGPMVGLPSMDGDHPFLPPWVKKAVAEGYRLDAYKDARELMNLMAKNLLKGSVDLGISKVFGAYQRLAFPLWLPRGLLDSDRYASAEGAAAIILHEVGHVFSYFEYIGRTVTTNQVLAGLVRAMDDAKGSTTREAVFARGANLLRMTSEQRQALLNAKSKAEVSVIVLDAAIGASRSELKFNIFDSTGCETLADQFAARHGAARALVIAEAEMARFYQERDDSHIAERVAAGVLVAVADLFSTVVDAIGFGLSFLSTYVFFAEYEVPDHNTLKGRYTRILNECTQRLQDRSLSKSQREQTLADYDAIRALVAQVNDNELPLLRKLSYYLHPRYRNARKFHLLQNDLEALASSSLFAQAARLSSL